MTTISLAMIVKNEILTIERCLNSIANIADEIIIVDTGSTDHTQELCLKYTDKIYSYKWKNDFSAARNYAYSKAQNDYILWLDADDILLPEDNVKFQQLKKELDGTTDVVMMRYNTGIDLQGNTTFSYYRERLTKRNSDFLWKEPVHEYIETHGIIATSDICITHGKLPSNKQTTRNIKIYESMLRKKTALSPRGMYYYARELKDHDRIAEAIVQFELFLNSGEGWMEDCINACSELAKCYLKIECKEKALLSMFRSFLYDTPRAEICCQIGYYFEEIQDYRKGAFWFQFIFTLKKPSGSWGFIQKDCWDYIPSIESAVCYDRLGDYMEAEKFNNMALAVKPNSAQALMNQRYLKTQTEGK